MNRVSIARSSLVYDWRRYLAAVLSVTFAGLLMLVQVALLQGLFRSVSVPIDQSSAQLWIGFPNTLSVDIGRGVTQHADTLARTHPEVQHIESLSLTGGDLRRDDGVALSVFVNLIDTEPGAMGFSRLLTPAQRVALDEPGALIIDVADQRKLGAKIGAILEVNGKRMRVVDAIEGLRAVGGVNTIASFESGRRLDANVRREEPQYFLVSLKPGANPQRVAREITDPGATPRWQVWVAHDFSLQSQSYWLFESGVGVGAVAGALLALVVGVVITSQTLAAAILASIKEFAALRALGVSRAALRAVVLQLSLWIGVVGLLLTAALAAGAVLLAEANYVAMVITPLTALATAGMVMLITTLSGLYALRPLFHAEPASLLR